MTRYFYICPLPRTLPTDSSKTIRAFNFPSCVWSRVNVLPAHNSGLCSRRLDPSAQAHWPPPTSHTLHTRPQGLCTCHLPSLDHSSPDICMAHPSVLSALSWDVRPYFFLCFIFFFFATMLFIFKFIFLIVFSFPHRNIISIMTDIFNSFTCCYIPSAKKRAWYIVGAH